MQDYRSCRFLGHLVYKANSRRSSGKYVRLIFIGYTELMIILRLGILCVRVRENLLISSSTLPVLERVSRKQKKIADFYTADSRPGNL